MVGIGIRTGQEDGEYLVPCSVVSDTINPSNSALFTGVARESRSYAFERPAESMDHVACQQPCWQQICWQLFRRPARQQCRDLVLAETCLLQHLLRVLTQERCGGLDFAGGAVEFGGEADVADGANFGMV